MHPHTNSLCACPIWSKNGDGEVKLVVFGFLEDMPKHDVGLLSEQMPHVFKLMKSGKFDHQRCTADLPLQNVLNPIFIADNCPKEFATEGWVRLQAALCYRSGFKRCDVIYGCPHHCKGTCDSTGAVIKCCVNKGIKYRKLDILSQR
jgi:hypothetical protein